MCSIRKQYPESANTTKSVMCSLTRQAISPRIVLNYNCSKKKKISQTNTQKNTKSFSNTICRHPHEFIRMLYLFFWILYQFTFSINIHWVQQKRIFRLDPIKYIHTRTYICIYFVNYDVCKQFMNRPLSWSILPEQKYTHEDQKATFALFPISLHWASTKLPL